MITSEVNGVKNFIIATPTKCGTTTLEELTRRHGGGRVSRGGVELDSFRIARDVLPRRQHRMCVPVGWEMATRALLVRNPFDRYVSMYEYMRGPQNYSKWGAREINGREWGGLRRGRQSAYAKDDPMTFAEFLHFIALSRKAYSARRWVKRRGLLTDPRAYRSPWVWLDSLTDSRRMLEWQPANADGDWYFNGIILVRLENLWADLAYLRDREQYQPFDLDLRPTIHANRTLTYGGRTAADYWRIGCRARKVKGGGWDVEDVRGKQGCECSVCAVGVVDEAVSLGYMHVGR